MVISRSSFSPLPLDPNLNPAALARVLGPQAISSARVQPRAHRAWVPSPHSQIRTRGRELDISRGRRRFTKRRIIVQQTTYDTFGVWLSKRTYDRLTQQEIDLVCEFVLLDERPIEHEIWDRIGRFYREVSAAIGRARRGAEEAARAPESGEGAAAASSEPSAPSESSGTGAAAKAQGGTEAGHFWPHQGPVFSFAARPFEEKARTRRGARRGGYIWEASFGAPTAPEVKVGGLGCSRWRTKGRVPHTVQARPHSAEAARPGEPKRRGT